MATNSPQVQCLIQCQQCDTPKVKWKCVDCNFFLCEECKNKRHSKTETGRDHIIIDIKELGQEPPSGVYELNITKIVGFGTECDQIDILAVSNENWLWYSTRFSTSTSASATTITIAKIEGEKLKNEYNLKTSDQQIQVWDMASTSIGDLLLAVNEPRLKIIVKKGNYVRGWMRSMIGLNKMKDSDYYIDSYKLISVHVAKDGIVIVGGVQNKLTGVFVMEISGKLLKMYENKFKRPASITCTSNDNIFVLDGIPQSSARIVVLGKTDIIRVYTGLLPTEESFCPSSLVATSMDNIIVADSKNHILHILNNIGLLLTTSDTKTIGIEFPLSLAVTNMDGYYVLCIGCKSIGREKAKLHIMNMLEYISS